MVDSYWNDRHIVAAKTKELDKLHYFMYWEDIDICPVCGVDVQAESIK